MSESLLKLSANDRLCKFKVIESRFSAFEYKWSPIKILARTDSKFAFSSRSLCDKSPSKYSFAVPIQKVDDISHVNFTDRDHLWFEPNWRKRLLSGKAKDTSDPMAEMLDNNAKNKNATHIFVNDLSEYAEVEQPLKQRDQQGPYATTNLVVSTTASNSSKNSVRS